ncbi:sensor histidine kinase [Leucothrix sargassi]|nr:sensor histidine kinase [Leucothrix sargassi]
MAKSALSKRHAPLLWLLVTVVFIGLAYLSQQRLHQYHYDREVEKSQESSRFYKASLLASLRRYDYLPTVLSNNNELFELAANQPSAANDMLRTIQQRSEADAVFILNTDGITIAASNAGTAGSFVGNTYHYRPYFTEAIDTGKGNFYGIGATTAVPGFFVSSRYPIDTKLPAKAVAVVKINLQPLLENWLSGTDTVFVSNSNGVIVLSSNNRWLYKTLGEISPEQLDNIKVQQQFASEPLSRLAIKYDNEGKTVELDKARYIKTAVAVGSELGIQDWTLHHLSPYKKVTDQTFSDLTKVIALLLAATAILLGIRFRSARAELKTSRGESSQLRELNLSLKHEIIERKQVEAELTKAQVDLRRTSKLTAMGQLSASITHELGQPLSAMRNYIATLQMASAKNNDERSEKTLGKLVSLVERMTNVTHQLRYFARSGDKEVHRINLNNTITGALSVTQPAIQAANVLLTTHAPTKPVEIMAGEVRMEQVLINLIQNALHAMQDSDDKRLDIRISHDDTTAQLSVSDTGHGIPESTLKELFEPFYSTKPSGIGMGLGLAISSNIITEVGGTLTAENIYTGGARFLVTVPLADNESNSLTQ